MIETLLLIIIIICGIISISLTLNRLSRKLDYIIYDVKDNLEIISNSTYGIRQDLRESVWDATKNSVWDSVIE